MSELKLLEFITDFSIDTYLFLENIIQFDVHYNFYQKTNYMILFVSIYTFGPRGIPQVREMNLVFTVHSSFRFRFYFIDSSVGKLILSVSPNFCFFSPVRF